MIKLLIWLNKLGYQYTNIKKGVFLHRHERLDVVEYQAQFLKKFEVLGLYFVEFYNNSFIEKKMYLLDYVVNGLNKRLVTLIIYNESIFLANDSQHQT